MLYLSLRPTLFEHLIAQTSFELADLVHTDWSATRDPPL